MNIKKEDFDLEPTPVCDSCAGSADRFGDNDVISVRIARKLEKEHRTLSRQLAQSEERVKALEVALEYVRATLMMKGNGNSATLTLEDCVLCMEKMNTALEKSNTLLSSSKTN